MSTGYKDKSPINVFVDTSIINNLFDLEQPRDDHPTWTQNVEYIELLLSGPISSGKIVLYVNPSVKQQISNTPDAKRRQELLSRFDELKLEEFNLTRFPFSFPGTFASKEQVDLIDSICIRHPKLERDWKIIGDAAFNDKIDILLTTDKKLAHQVAKIGKVSFMLPKELWEHTKHKA